jgi:hypothetical protein
VKNQWETISNEEKSDIISQLDEDEQIFYVCCNLSCIRTICANADRIKEIPKFLDNIKPAI